MFEELYTIQELYNIVHSEKMSMPCGNLQSGIQLMLLLRLVFVRDLSLFTAT